MVVVGLSNCSLPSAWGLGFTVYTHCAGRIQPESCVWVLTEFGVVSL